MSESSPDRAYLWWRGGWQPCRRAVVKNMAMGALKWENAITHRVEHTDAPAIYARINAGADKDIVGVVIHWAD